MIQDASGGCHARSKGSSLTLMWFLTYTAKVGMMSGFSLVAARTCRYQPQEVSMFRACLS